MINFELLVRSIVYFTIAIQLLFRQFTPTNTMGHNFVNCLQRAQWPAPYSEKAQVPHLSLPMK